jgi:hypothetical protein
MFAYCTRMHMLPGPMRTHVSVQHKKRRSEAPLACMFAYCTRAHGCALCAADPRSTTICSVDRPRPTRKQTPQKRTCLIHPTPMTASNLHTQDHKRTIEWILGKDDELREVLCSVRTGCFSVSISPFILRDTSKSVAIATIPTEACHPTSRNVPTVILQTRTTTTLSCGNFSN